MRQKAYLESNLRRWTPSAINCYDRHCNCDFCEMEEYCKNASLSNPYGLKAMKYSVIKLVEKLGRPKGDANHILLCNVKLLKKGKIND